MLDPFEGDRYWHVNLVGIHTSDGVIKMGVFNDKEGIRYHPIRSTKYDSVMSPLLHPSKPYYNRASFSMTQGNITIPENLWKEFTKNYKSKYLYISICT